MTPVYSDLLHADFALRMVLPPPTAENRMPSLAPGVYRHWLDRIGDEAAHASSVVRDAAPPTIEQW